MCCAAQQKLDLPSLSHTEQRPLILVEEFKCIQNKRRRNRIEHLSKCFSDTFSPSRKKTLLSC
jgi:hypothetical protein